MRYLPYTLALFAALLWTGQGAEAQSKLIHIPYGPISPKAGDITPFSRVQLPKDAPPSSQIRGCTSTTFNGLSAPVDVSGSYIIFNVPLPGGALFANVICSAVSFDKLAVYPSQATLTRYGQQLHLRVVGLTAQSEEVDLHSAKDGTTYQSSKPTVAEVGPDGVVTARASGTTSISIKQGDLSATVALTVQLSKPLGIVLRPSILRFSKAGESQEVKVMLLYPDAYHEATGQVKYSIDATAIASIANSTVTALKPGKALLTATVAGLSAQALIDVEGTAFLTALSVAPTSLSLKTKGEAQQLKVTGTYSDNSTLDLSKASSGIQYASSSPSVAKVSADGVVQAVANGNATITIQHPALAGKSATVSVSVQVPNLQRITVAPDPVVLKQVGQTVQLKVTGEYADNSTRDLSANPLTQYQSQDATTATVSSSGLVTAVKLGTTSLTVSYDGKQVQVPVQIAQSILSSIAFSRSSLKLTQNAIDTSPTSVQLKITGTYDDKSTGDLTLGSTGTTYKSSNTAVATVDKDGKLFAGSAAGQTTLTATHKTKTATLVVTVTRFRSQSLTRLPLPGPSEDVAIVEKIAYVAAADKGLHMVDISNPAQPRLLRTLRGFGYVASIREMGNYALLSDNKGALHLMPTSNPQFVESVASVPLSGGAAHGAAFWQDRMFVAAGKAGVAAVSITQITKPALLGTTKQGDVQAIAADGRWVAALDAGRVLFYDHTGANWWSQAASRTIVLAGARRIVASGSATFGAFYVAAQDGVYRVDSTGAKVKVTTPGTLLGRALSKNPRWLAVGGKFFGRNEAALFNFNQARVATYRANFPFATLGGALQAEGLRNRRGFLWMALGADGLQVGQYRQWFDLDTVAPTVALTYPKDNHSQPETADLHFVVDASDDREIDKVEYRLNNQLIATQRTRPFRLSYPAPDVSQNTAVLLEATAYDMAGTKTSSKSITVNLTPVTDTKAPTVQLTQPTDQDEVEIGRPMIVRSRAQDDQRVAEVRLLINGTQVAKTNMPPFAFSYTVPANTPDETAIQVQLEAVDYGGLKSRSTAATVLAVKLTPLTRDLSATDKAFDNKRIAIRGRSVRIDGAHTFKSLWVEQGATLRHSATTTSAVHRLDINADYVFISADSKIDVSGLGYLAASKGGNGTTGRTRGNSTTGGARGRQGGAHGGPGGHASTVTPAPPAYDSMFEPNEPGGGSGITCTGDCNGGGVVRIQCKNLKLAGQLLANGAPDDSPSSGGAGGAVYIKTQRLSGGGLIAANGGGRFDQATAPGAGGRVAIYYDSLHGFSLSQISAHGAGSAPGDRVYSFYASGGPGTIYTKSKAQSYGSLRLDSKSPANAVQITPLPQVGRGTVTGVTRNTLTDANASWQPGDLVGLWVTPNVGQASRSYRITANTATTLTLDVGSDDITTTTRVNDTYHGLLRLDALIVARRAQVSTEDRLEVGRNASTPGLQLQTGGLVRARSLILARSANLTLDGVTLQIGSTLSIAALTLKNTALLTGFPATTQAHWPVSLDLTGALSLDATSRIDVSAQGYLAAGAAGNGTTGRTEGNSTTGGARGRQGGAHGGPGGYGQTQKPFPSAYGSLFSPKTPGGGAGACSPSDNCSGGGVISIKAASLQCDGVIAANGGPEPSPITSSAGGAGGSIAIVLSGALQGKGTIEAHGGGTPDQSTGPAAGGRIAVYYGSLSGFPKANIRAFGIGGGPRSPVAGDYISGGAGTVFLKSQSQTYGSLIADLNNPQRRVQATILPQVGKGTLTGVTRDTLTDANATWTPGQLVDHHINPNTAQSKTYRITANTATTLTLDVGSDNLAALAKVGDSYHGVLLLDELVVKNRAIVRTDDQVRVGLGGGAGLVLSKGELQSGPLSLDKNSSLTLDGGTLTTPSSLELQGLRLTNGAVLRVPEPTSTAYFPLKLTIANTLEIDATSRIDLTGAGYPGGNPASSGRGYYHGFATALGPNYGAGGSHGGTGGAFYTFSSKAGPTFGRLHDPIEPGGGGGCSTAASCVAGAGGGYLEIQADILDVKGQILSNGGPGEVGGGGAGGGIKIVARLLSGGGTIAANGGSAATSFRSAGGAGGRIAVTYTTLQGFNPATQITAFPGALGDSRNTPAAAGTVFYRATTQSHGTLKIDQNNLAITGFPTELLSIGEGTSTSLAASLLTNSAAAFAPDHQLVGLWLNPDINQNKWFKLTANTATSLSTRASDGSLLSAASNGATYRGVLRLDALIITRGARVKTADQIDAASVQVSPTSALQSQNLLLPQCPATCTQSSQCQVPGCGSKQTCSGGSCQ